MKEEPSSPVVQRMASVVSHELRNPLAVINNSIYFLKAKLAAAGPVDEKVAKHLNIIESEVRTADQVVGSMLSYSRKLELMREKRELAPLIEQTLEVLPPPAGIKLEKKLAHKGEAFVDGERLKLALGHVLKNAYESQPKGGVVKLSSSGQGDAFELTVVDEGEGIPADKLPHIFEAFYTTKPRGIGLGLTLAKRILQAHGGAIELTTKEGKGTTVRLSAGR